MPFSISKQGYGGNDNLGALIGSDFAKYKTTNPYGLQDYTPEGFGNVSIGGGQYNVRYDPSTDKYALSSLDDPHLGSYVYGNDGKLQNYTPYNSGNDWGNFGMFLASALTMGAAGMAGAAGGTAADSAVGGAGGFVGEGAMSGVPAWDAAGTSLGGTGAMGAGGAALGGEAAGGVGGTAAGTGEAAGGVAGGPGSAGWGMDLGGAGAPDAAASVGSPVAGSGTNYLSSLGSKLGIGSGSDLGSAAIKYGAPLLGSAISANAAGKAADTQAAATDRANALLNGQYNTTRNDLAPWRDSGIKANNALVSAMGLGANDGSAGYGSLTKPFTGADLQNEPGYQFGLTQGQRAIDSKAASGGSYYSGNALKAAATYGNDYASTKYTDAFNRDASTKNQQYGFLSGMSTQGQNAANMTGQLGANTTNAIAGNTTALGNAQGASQIAQGNALSNGLSSVTNAYNQDNMLQQILASNQRQQLLLGGNSNGLR